MKINGIHINDFQQFKDFHLDLTYPKGHEKEGQPLDKICFIGQSGTGKTTLLNIIMEFTKKLNSISTNYQLYHKITFNPKADHLKADYSINSKNKDKLKIETDYFINNHVFQLSKGKFS